MALDERKGVWKSGKGKGRTTPKGRQLDDQAWDEVRALLGDRRLRRSGCCLRRCCRLRRSGCCLRWGCFRSCLAR